MGQKLFNDKIGTLSHSGGTITMAASSSSPAYLSIGGQQYKITSNLTLAVGTATANTLYMIYAVLNAGVVELVKSTNVNSTGPAGENSWKLVAAFYTGVSDTFGSFVSIEGTPTSNYFNLSGWSYENFGTPTNEFFYLKRIGKDLIGRIRWDLSANPTSIAALVMPSGFTFSSDLESLQTHQIGEFQRIRSGASEEDQAINIITGFYDGSTSNKIYFNRSSASSAYEKSNTSGLAGVGDTLELEVKIPIDGWNNTPLKDL